MNGEHSNAQASRTEDLKLSFEDDIDFEVDRDGDLCIEVMKGYEVARTWLSRAEGQKVLDLLTRWLK